MNTYPYGWNFNPSEYPEEYQHVYALFDVPFEHPMLVVAYIQKIDSAQNMGKEINWRLQYYDVGELESDLCYQNTDIIDTNTNNIICWKYCES